MDIRDKTIQLGLRTPETKHRAVKGHQKSDHGAAEVHQKSDHGAVKGQQKQPDGAVKEHQKQDFRPAEDWDEPIDNNQADCREDIN